MNIVVHCATSKEIHTAMLRHHYQKEAPECVWPRYYTHILLHCRICDLEICICLNYFHISDSRFCSWLYMVTYIWPIGFIWMIHLMINVKLLSKIDCCQIHYCVVYHICAESSNGRVMGQHYFKCYTTNKYLSKWHTIMHHGQQMNKPENKWYTVNLSVIR